MLKTALKWIHMGCVYDSVLFLASNNKSLFAINRANKFIF